VKYIALAACGLLVAWQSGRGRCGDQGRGGRSREPARLPARPSRSPVAGVRSTAYGYFDLDRKVTIFNA
jgi:hypothetical protein